MAQNWVHLGGEFGPVVKFAMTDLQQRRAAFFTPYLAVFALRDTLVAMRDGDNSNVSHYQEIAIRFSTDGGDPFDQVVANTNAKSFMDQVESACGILEDPNSTRAQIEAACEQAEAWLKIA